MSSSSLPTRMRHWSYTSAANGPINGLNLTTSSLPTLPSPSPSSGHSTLIRTAYASLNPVDVKLATMPILGRIMFPLPATPAQECSGRVVSSTDPNLKPGQLVTARLTQSRGALAQYALIHGTAAVAAVPEGVSAVQAATAGTCGILAVQTLRPFAKEAGKAGRKTRIFVNGGSGGVGSWMVQVARAMDMDVVASCSGSNAELVRGLGAQEVLDYRSVDVGKELGDRVDGGTMEPFDAVIDTRGRARKGLYRASERFLRKEGTYVQIGGEQSMGEIWDMLLLSVWPGKRKWKFETVGHRSESLEEAVRLMAEGKVKVPVEEVVPFEEAPRGYEKLLAGRVRGKVVVKVGGNE